MRREQYLAEVGAVLELGRSEALQGKPRTNSDNYLTMRGAYLTGFDTSSVFAISRPWALSLAENGYLHGSTGTTAATVAYPPQLVMNQQLAEDFNQVYDEAYAEGARSRTQPVDPGKTQPVDPGKEVTPGKRTSPWWYVVLGGVVAAVAGAVIVSLPSKRGH